MTKFKLKQSMNHFWIVINLLVFLFRLQTAEHLFLKSPLSSFDVSFENQSQSVHPIGPESREHNDLRFIDENQRNWFEQTFVDANDEEIDPFGLWYPTRYRRQLPSAGVSLGPQMSLMYKPVYVIRLAVFYDAKLNQMHSDKQKLNSFIKGILQQVQLIYRYRSMQTRIRIQVISVEQVSGNPTPNTGGGEVDTYLDSFCAWQQSQLLRRKPEDQWNHAILLTGERLYRVREDGQKDFKVLGMAWVNGMCNINLSCTLQEAESFEAGYTIAHEMGHSLGILHDGKENNCDHTKYLMSNTTGTGKVHWSSCSNTYLRRFLQSQYGSCLSTNVPVPSVGAIDTKLPGEQNNPTSQCLMARGPSAQAYLNVQAPFNNICHMLWCRVGSFAFATHPALEGSKCSADGECYQGECISKRSPKYVSLRKEAITAIRDLMQLSAASRSSTTSLPKSTTAGRTRPKMASLEKRRPNVNKAKAASLNHNSNSKKNVGQKKRLKSSEILTNSILKSSKTTNTTTSSIGPNLVSTAIESSVARAEKESQSKSLIDLKSKPNENVNPIKSNIKSSVKPQPKLMNDLKSFFRELTSKSRGFFNIFKSNN